jgi:hypothetical protein
MTHPSERFIWFELSARDPKAAEAFYQRTIGWEMKDSGATKFSYTFFSAGGINIGGIMPFNEACGPDAKSGWVGYIGVDDVDAYAARVVDKGGSIRMAPSDIPDVGRFSVVADPYGAVFTLFKGRGDDVPAPVPPGTPGHIGWHELHAGEWKGAFDFYEGLFGWTKAEAFDMGPMGTYQTFTTGGAPSGAMMTRVPDFPFPGWLYYFNVDGIDAAMARVLEGGGKVLMGPHEVPGSQWILQCLDPQGTLFALLSSRR